MGNKYIIAEWHHFCLALHTRALLGQDELTASEIPDQFGEQNSYLNRESEIGIDVLMQAIKVTKHIPQEQRRRADLAA